LKKTTPMKTKKIVRMPLRKSAQRTRPSNSLLPARAAAADEAYDDEEDYGGEDEPNMKFSHAVLVVLVLHVIAVGGIFAFNSIKARQTSEAKAIKAVPAATTAAATDAAAESEKPAAAASTSAKAADKAETASAGKTHTIQAGDTLTRVAALYDVKVSDLEKENEITSLSMLRVGQVLKIPSGAKTTTTKAASTTPAKPAATTTTAVEKPAAAKPAPAQATAAAAAPAADQPGAHGSVSGDTYVVVKGDNPYSIAKKLHVSYNDLLAANDIKDATKIQIGQKLKIPTKK